MNTMKIPLEVISRGGFLSHHGACAGSCHLKVMHIQFLCFFSGESASSDPDIESF